LQCIGLRYFNVFDPRQNPNGPYAAATPKWFAALKKGEEVFVYGDGETNRDFFLQHARKTMMPQMLSTTLRTAKEPHLMCSLTPFGMRSPAGIRLRPSRCHDTKPSGLGIFASHSPANVEKAKNLLGYAPKYSVTSGLRIAAEFYLSNEMYEQSNR
jgi:UDP-N-acetylglucosamine/UDP-N-acetylgalactosamine 4-epimerase